MSEANVPVRSRRQWEALARARLMKGEPGATVEADFVRQGLDVETAWAIVDEALRRSHRRALGLFIGGGLFALLGIIVTVGSFFSATDHGQSEYLIWWGPVVVGGIVSVVGLVRLLSVSR